MLNARSLASSTLLLSLMTYILSVMINLMHYKQPTIVSFCLSIAAIILLGLSSIFIDLAIRGQEINFRGHLMSFFLLSCSILAMSCGVYMELMHDRRVHFGEFAQVFGVTVFFTLVFTQSRSISKNWNLISADHVGTWPVFLHLIFLPLGFMRLSRMIKFSAQYPGGRSV